MRIKAGITLKRQRFGIGYKIWLRDGSIWKYERAFLCFQGERCDVLVLD
jgi:hypothetical protein